MAVFAKVDCSPVSKDTVKENEGREEASRYEGGRLKATLKRWRALSQKQDYSILRKWEVKKKMTK